MKKIKQISICLLLLVSISAIGQKMTKGVVKYTMTSDNEQMAMMGEVAITNYFNETDSAVEIDMMGGMLVTKVYTKFSEPNKPTVTMDAMGNKFQVSEVDEKIKGGADFSDLKNAESVIYDKKDTKEILGYVCYKADVKYNDGKTAVIYLTDEISPKTINNPNEKVKLNGFPLEMTITSDDGILTIIAKEVSNELPKDCFTISDEYEKITMEELEERMGG